MFQFNSTHVALYGGLMRELIVEARSAEYEPAWLVPMPGRASGLISRLTWFVWREKMRLGTVEFATSEPAFQLKATFQ